MEALLVILLSLGLMAYIGYPLYQTRRLRISFALNHRAEELQSRKAEIYAAIKDIEFDFQMGKISEEDFNELRDHYRAEAVRILKQIDALKLPKTDKKRERSEKSAVRFCAECGQPAAKGDNFCTDCGAKLV